jgi:hypothetical protein
MKNGKEGGNGMLERIDDMAGIAVVKAKYLGFKAKEKFVDFVTKENGDVNVVSIVILIGIAVVLALMFKKQIVTILQRLLKAIGTKADEATKEVS